MEGKLKDVKLIKENDSYFLNLTYEHEDDEAIYETIIHKAYLPINKTGFEYYEDNYDTRFGRITHSRTENHIDIGFGKLRLFDNDNGAILTTITVETKTKEMTIEEIEKALGHKVKIVGDKDEEDEIPYCSDCKYHRCAVNAEPCVDCKGLDYNRPHNYFKPKE